MGFTVGQLVWAKQDISVDPNAVAIRSLDRGLVQGAPETDDRSLLAVRWDRRCDTQEPCIIHVPADWLTATPQLPGGFTVGQLVWAKQDISVDPNAVAIRSLDRGLVQGASE